MKFIGKLIDKGYITPAQARTIEAFILGTLISLGVGVLDNIDVIIDGGSVDWILFFVTFGATTAKAITLGFKKYLRDIK